MEREMKVFHGQQHLKQTNCMDTSQKQEEEKVALEEKQRIERETEIERLKKVQSSVNDEADEVVKTTEAEIGKLEDLK